MSAPADNVYCTVFDAGYLTRALALHASMLETNAAAHFAFVCLDALSAELLAALAPTRATVVRYADFATAELDRVRDSRSRGEFSWTCKAFALQHLARTYPQASWLIYLDADMMAFGDPDAALPGPEAHYLLTPHRFHAAFLGIAGAAGEHNAGYFAMRNSAEGRSVVRWWGERCLESCSVVATETTYADQRYLDAMPGLFRFGAASAHPGLNAAPWNIERYRVTGAGGKVMLDGAPLLLYHFQSLRVLTGWLVDLYAGDRRLTAAVRRLIYGPYVARLSAAHGALRKAFGARAPALESPPRSARDWARLAYGAARGRYNLVAWRLVP